MTKTSTDYQPTPLSPVSREPSLADPAAGAADAEASPLPDGIARRTGVVFVHGIGTQQPAETFLEWSAPIVELLSEWRRDQQLRASPPGEGGAPPVIDPEVLLDPVRRAVFSFNAAAPPFLEIAIPAHADVPETTWVVTEAWWAAELRPPDLGNTLGYLRRRMRTIVSGIAAGYRGRTDNLIDMAAEQGLIDRARPPRGWRLIDLLDRVQAHVFGARPIGWSIGIAGTGLLIGYDLLRRIPIGPVRDFAARKMIDSFLVDWFGDLPILIDDPVQSANVRARLAESIRGLREKDCDAVVIVAHSGGALVSFEMLLDPAYLGPDYRVDKLITLGQGLGLAWRLAADPNVREITPGHRLVGNLARARPDIRWVDFWASYDPAPAGPLPARGGLAAIGRPETDGRVSPQTAAVVETGEGRGGEGWLVRADVGASSATRDAAMQTAEASQAKQPEMATEFETAPPTQVIEVESRPVTNQMNVLADHGGYWTNEEGFLVPLVRHIDGAIGAATASRFYRDRRSRTMRIVWRRERVSALAAWDWLCSLAAIAMVGLLAGATLLASDRRLASAGDAVAGAWSFVPGHELISGPVDGLGGLVDTIAKALGWDGLTAWAGSIGPPLLGVALVIVLYGATSRIGDWRWHDWDRRERVLFRSDEPAVPDRRRAAAQAIALLGGFGAVTLALLTGDGRLAFGAWATGAVIGLLRWATSSPVPPVHRPPPT